MSKQGMYDGGDYIKSNQEYWFNQRDIIQRHNANVAAIKAEISLPAEASSPVLPREGDRSSMASEQSGTTMKEEKPRYDLIPVTALEQAAKVLAFGSDKYTDRDWESRGIRYGKLYAALQRHLNAFWRGEDIDPESGLPHLGHALTRLLMLTELTLSGSEDLDDRSSLSTDGVSSEGEGCDENIPSDDQWRASWGLQG